MVLQPKQRELRVREIRTALLDAMRSPTPSGALLKLREAAEQLTILIRLETGTGTDDATPAEDTTDAMIRAAAKPPTPLW